MQNEKSQYVDESNNNSLYQKKNCSGQMGHCGPEMTHPHNSGSALRIFLKFWDYWEWFLLVTVCQVHLKRNYPTSLDQESILILRLLIILSQKKLLN